jgi:hypothetical protein
MNWVSARCRRASAAHQREAAAGDLGRGGEIEQFQVFADIDVIQRRVGELARRADAAHFDVVLSSLPTGTDVVRQVGDVHHERGQIILDAGQAIFLALLQFFAQAANFVHQRAGVLAFAFRHADLLGQLIAPGLQVLRARLDFLAFGFQRLDARGVKRKAPAGQALRHIGEVFAKELDVEHGIQSGGER